MARGIPALRKGQKVSQHKVTDTSRVTNQPTTKISSGLPKGLTWEVYMQM